VTHYGDEKTGQKIGNEIKTSGKKIGERKKSADQNGRKKTGREKSACEKNRAQTGGKKARGEGDRKENIHKKREAPC